MIGFYGVDEEGVVEENAEWKAVESCVRLYRTKLILELITSKFLTLYARISASCNKFFCICSIFAFFL